MQYIDNDHIVRCETLDEILIKSDILNQDLLNYYFGLSSGDVVNENLNRYYQIEAGEDFSDSDFVLYMIPKDCTKMFYINYYGTEESVIDLLDFIKDGKAISRSCVSNLTSKKELSTPTKLTGVGFL
jgi:hypothetical protein